MDDFTPETQPGGALVPPPRIPPGAVATAAPLPPRPHRHDTTPATRWRSLRAVVDAALDQLDRVGDRIADAVGLR